jgi:hypothetical protein
MATSTKRSAVALAPRLSIVESRTLNEPAESNLCVTTLPEAVRPSSKSHRYSATPPSGSFEFEASNRKDVLRYPEGGVTVNDARGTWLSLTWNALSSVMVPSTA